MRLSADRISHIAHLIVDKLWRDDLVDFTSEEKALQEVKSTIADYLKVEDEADSLARKKIRSLSREVPEGSREWEILYRKYFEEEMNKKKAVFS